MRLRIGDSIKDNRIRIKERKKAKIEEIVEDSGLWGNTSGFVRNAIDECINRFGG